MQRDGTLEPLEVKIILWCFETTPPSLGWSHPTFFDRFPSISCLSNYHSAFHGSIYQYKGGEDPEAHTPFSESSHLLLLSCLFGDAFVFAPLLSGGADTPLWRHTSLRWSHSAVQNDALQFDAGACSHIYPLQGEIHWNSRWRHMHACCFSSVRVCVSVWILSTLRDVTLKIISLLCLKFKDYIRNFLWTTTKLMQ